MRSSAPNRGAEPDFAPVRGSVPGAPRPCGGEDFVRVIVRNSCGLLPTSGNVQQDETTPHRSARSLCHGVMPARSGNAVKQDPHRPLSLLPSNESTDSGRRITRGREKGGWDGRTLATNPVSLSRAGGRNSGETRPPSGDLFGSRLY